MSEAKRTSLLVTDGDCGFCQNSAKWLERYFPGAWINQPSQKLNLANFNLLNSEVEQQVWYLVPKKILKSSKTKNQFVNDDVTSDTYQKYGGAKAVAKLLLDQPKKYIKPFALLAFLPLFDRVAQMVYLLVARNRGSISRFTKKNSSSKNSSCEN